MNHWIDKYMDTICRWIVAVSILLLIFNNMIR